MLLVRIIVFTGVTWQALALHVQVMVISQWAHSELRDNLRSLLACSTAAMEHEVEQHFFLGAPGSREMEQAATTEQKVH
eukprot:913391-Amphidinium_carterae.1